MIRSFSCSDTEKLFHGQRVKRFISVERAAIRKLNMLHIVTALEQLRVPPANRLELLKGKRRGQYSIRINDQWRLCFHFTDGNAYEVEIADYH